MKHCIKKFFIGLLSFSVVFCNNMTILADTREEDNTSQPEETQEDTPVGVNEEGNLNEQEPEEEPEPSEDPEQGKNEEPSETSAPEPEVREANTEPEQQQEEEPAEEVSYTILAYCFDGTNGIEGYENVDITEAVAAYGDTGALTEDLAPVIDGYSFDVAMINGIYAGGLRYNAYVSDHDWTSFETVADENHSVTVSFTYHKDEPEIIEETEPEYKYHFEYDDSRVYVIADANDDAKIPADAQLYADYLVPGSPEYQDAVNQLLDGEEQDHKTEFELYDIYFLSDNERIEPTSSVDVTLTFKQAVAPSSENGEISDVEVVHIDEEKGAEVISDDITTSSEGEIKEISFTSDSFSPFGVKYTVDYTYDGYTWSMIGGSEIYLSELFAELGINEEVTNVTYVEFTDDNLISVTQVSGNWLLTSLQAFDTEETLTVTMENGDKYVIGVTDEATTSTDLTNFIQSVSIDAPMENGAYVVADGEYYKVTLSFAEGTEYQFPNDGSDMTYSLPNGLNAADQAAKELIIQVSDSHNTYNVRAFYFVSDNKVHFNFDENDPHFPELTSTSNVEFHLDFSASFSADSGTIVFPGGKEVVINKDQNANITPEKSAHYDSAANKVNYQIKLKNDSLVTATEVAVSDTITGTALTFDANSLVMYSTKDWQRSNPSYTAIGEGKGFSFTIPSIAAGEEVYLEYTASVNLEGITNKGTVEQTGNTIKVKPKNGDENTSSKNLENEIDYGSVSKSGSAEEGSENTKTVTWTIVVNEDAVASMNGKKITDAISASSQSIMKYSGTGITIEKYKKGETSPSESPVNVTWESLSVQPTTNKTWNYTFTDDTPYKYVITYTTDVDVSNQITDTTVSNTATDDLNHSSTGTVTVEPGDKKVAIAKDVVETKEDTVTWKTTITVPASGLAPAQATVTDTLPMTWIGSPYVFDDLVAGSVVVDGLRDNEQAVVSGRKLDANAQNPYFTVEFQYRENGSSNYQPGLFGTGSERTVTITYQTTNDSDWVAQLPNDEHTNKARIDGLTEVYAKTRIPAKGTVREKLLNSSGTVDINGVTYPVYKFQLSLVNVNYSNIESIEVEDKFDTNYFRYFDIYQEAHTNITINENTEDEKLRNSGWGLTENENPATVTSTDDGIKLTFTKANNQIPETNEAGEYYFQYFLVVKDEAALNALNQATAQKEGDESTFTNTAFFGNSDKNANFSYKYKGLKKELLTAESALHGDSPIYADYRITLNEAAEKLSTTGTLTMTDTFENISIDYTSIKAVPSAGVSWDFSGNAATFTIPDETKVVITYRARVIKTGQISNTAEMLTFKDAITKNATVNTSAGGSASILSINLMKYEAGDQNKRLQGAVFALLDANKNPVVYGAGANKGKPVTFTTGTDGMIHVIGHQDTDGWTLAYDRIYYLRETEAPSGYKLATFDYQFQISKSGEADYSKYIYHDDDTMSAKNYPGTQVDVKKEWSDGEAPHSNDSVTVQLQQKIGSGDFSNSIDLLDGKPAKEMTIVLNAENFWEGTFASLPTKNDNGDLITYNVIETLVNGQTPINSGYSVEYQTASKTDPQTGVTHGYVFTVRNSRNEIEFSVTGTKQLKRNNTAIDFENEKFAFRLEPYSAVDGTTTITDKNEARTVLSGATDSSQTAGLNFGKLYFDRVGVYTYKVYETTASGNGITTDSTMRYLEVTVTQESTGLVASGKTYYLDNGNKQYYSDTKAGLSFVNTIQTGSLKITKTAVTQASSGTFSFSVYLENNGKALAGDYVVEITDSNATVSTTTKHLEAGKLTVNLASGQTAEIKDLPVDTKFTVTETSDNGDYKVEIAPSDTGTIGTGTATVSAVTFTNTDNRVGKLIVKKEIAGNAKKTSDLFEFKVELFDKDNHSYTPTNCISVPSGISFNNGTATFSLKGGEQASFSNLPYGIKYKVTETNANEYVADPANAIEGVIDDESADDPSVALFTNTKDLYGALSVTKTVVPAGTAEDKEYEFTIILGDTDFIGKVTVSPATGTTGETREHLFHNGVATFDIKANEVALVTGIPNGTTYTITEKDYSSEGYVTTKTNCSGTIAGTVSDKSAAIAPDLSNVAVITNTKHEYGDLVISKTVEGNAAETDKDFTFEVTLSGEFEDSQGVRHNVSNGTYTFDVNTFVDGVLTFNLKDGETKTAKQIPAGLHYKVEEIFEGTTTDNYITSVSLNGGTAVSATILEDTIKPSSGTNQGYNNVSFTNTRNAKGGIKLSKETAGNDPDKKTWFAFKITLSDTSINGTYGDVTFKNGVSVRPASDADKEGVGEDYFTITKTQGAVITNLPSGITYTIEEDDYSLTYDSKEFKWANGSSTSSSSATGTVQPVKYNDETVTENDIPAENTVICTNTRNRTGKLRIEKYVEGDNAESTQEFSIKVKFTSNIDSIKNRTFSEVTFNENAEAIITLKANQSKTIKELPIGSNFEVSEVTSALPNGYLLKYYQLKHNDSTDTITGNKVEGSIDIKQTTVAVTNIFSAKGHINLSAKKTVNGKTPADSEIFGFSIRSVDADQNTISGVSQTIYNSGETVRFNQINYSNADLGKTFYYIVKESSKDEKGVITDKSEYLVTVVLPDAREIQSDGTVVPTVTYKRIKNSDGNADNSTVTEMTFNNQYDALGSASFEATKTLNGKDMTAGQFEFTIKNAQGAVFATGKSTAAADGTPSPIEWTYTGQDKVNFGLSDAGNTFVYTITESAVTELGYVAEVKEYKASITVSDPGNGRLNAPVVYTDDAGKTHEKAEFVNNYKEGGLKIKKVVSGNGADIKKEFNFTITLDEKTINGKYGDIEFKDGTATFTLKSGQTKTIEKLPQNIGYKVEEKEADADGYKTTVVNGEGTITGDKTIEVKFTNTKKSSKSTTRTIKLKKVWDDNNNASGTRPSSIKVHLLADGIDTGKTAELSEANNWIYTWISLPLNNAEGNPINYTVVEEEVEGYTNTVRGSMTSGFTITNSNKKKSPKTDDAYHIFKWTVSFITSMVVSLIAALLLRRKK